MPSIAFAAGETSGDIHAGNLAAELIKQIPGLTLWGIGGPSLAASGARIIYPSSELAAMGVVEVVGKLPRLFKARKLFAAELAANPPDLFIPVDFGGFNLKLAALAKARSIPVVYYIPPKAWAWGAGRVKKIKATVEEVLTILPFEADFWNENGVKATYVGSPILDHLKPRAFDSEPDLVGLLPGSRVAEVTKIWPPMAEAARLIAAKKPVRFILGRAPELPEGLPDTSLLSGLSIETAKGGAQEVMERSSLCLVASGTATLECALLGTPMVVVYNMNPLTVFAAKKLVKAPYFALPNLVAGRLLVPELMQAKPGDTASHALALLGGTVERRKMLEGFKEVRALFGEAGASARAAAIIAARFPGRAA